MDENIFSFMTLEELAAYIDQCPEITEQDRMRIEDRLMFRASLCGRLLDTLAGIDPQKGKPVRYGTPNRSSHTYKIRKAAGYSYP